MKTTISLFFYELEYGHINCKHICNKQNSLGKSNNASLKKLSRRRKTSQPIVFVRNKSVKEA
jgi:hypothetical protein